MKTNHEEVEFKKISIHTDSRLVDLESPYEIASRLAELARGDVLAIRVKKWRPAEDCLADVKVLKALADGAYSQEPTLRKGGPTVYDYEAREHDSAAYFSTAQNWNRVHREAFASKSSAPERIAAILGETHGAGVRPEPLSAKQVPCMQVVRAYGPGSSADPHCDRTDWDWPTNSCAASQQALFSALTYHSVASLGGALVLYGDKLTKVQWSDAREEQSAYALDVRKLNPGPLEIQPDTGDLIIFDAHRVHSVRLIVSGERVTSSNFYAWRGQQNPLGRFA